MASLLDFSSPTSTFSTLGSLFVVVVTTTAIALVFMCCLAIDKSRSGIPAKVAADDGDEEDELIT
eukprot:8161622-Ditylum_brightwellii.AAC.1